MEVTHEQLVDWSEVPSVFCYAAVDADGCLFLYEDVPSPRLSLKSWIPHTFTDDVSLLRKLDMAGVPKDYWRNSLVFRSKPARRKEDQLTIASFQEECRKTAVYPGKGTVSGLLYCALGLAEEAGECVGKIKKMLRDGGGVLTEDVIEGIVLELGDLSWYQSTMADEIGRSLQHIMQKNVEKLADRKARGAIGGSGDNR